MKWRAFLVRFYTCEGNTILQPLPHTFQHFPKKMSALPVLTLSVFSGSIKKDFLLYSEATIKDQKPSNASSADWRAFTSSPAHKSLFLAEALHCRGHSEDTPKKKTKIYLMEIHSLTPIFEACQTIHRNELCKSKSHCPYGDVNQYKSRYLKVKLIFFSFMARLNNEDNKYNTWNLSVLWSCRMT